MNRGIWTSQEARAQDHQAQMMGVPYLSLMELAGFQTARLVQRDFPNPRTSMTIVVGRGSNGGDGLVAARHLAAFYPVSLYIVSEPPTFLGSADLLQAAKTAGARIDQTLDQDLIIDAVFGTGYHETTRGELFNEVLDRVYRRNNPVIAVDLVSRIDADTGAYPYPIGSAVTTITFGATKWGHWGYPGAAARGKLVLADIGLPASQDLGDGWVSADAAKDLLPRLNPLGHKYQRGRVVVIGGSENMPGAPALSGIAALRAGAGLVTVIVPEGLKSRVQVPSPILLHEAPARHGSLRWSPKETALCQKADVILIGPGLGSEVPPEVFRDVAGVGRPLVIDADGLPILGVGLPEDSRTPLILTPHSGEAGRLLGISAREVDRNRPGAVRELMRKYPGATVILKGAFSITGSNGRLRVNTTGTPEMATPGSGDVLAGMVAGLLGQRLSAADAAELATYWHGWAGEMAAEDVGATLIATDLIDALPRAWRRIQSNRISSGTPEILT